MIFKLFHKKEIDPTNLTECIDIIESWYTKDYTDPVTSNLVKSDLRCIDELGHIEGMIEFHAYLGRYVRNKWLWNKTILFKYFQNFGLQHPDDMSHYILKAFWQKRHNCFNQAEIEKEISEQVIKDIIE